MLSLVKISQSLPFILLCSNWSKSANHSPLFYNALIGQNQPITALYFTMLSLVKISQSLPFILPRPLLCVKLLRESSFLFNWFNIYILETLRWAG
jgi:hypothetical protein